MSVLARKTIREWFRKHPNSVVSYHWRWDQLSPASKENMSSIRTATVHPKRVVFGPHQSEMSLNSNIFGCNVTPDGRLQIYFDGQGGVGVEYKSVQKC